MADFVKKRLKLILSRLRFSISSSPSQLRAIYSQFRFKFHLHRAVARIRLAQRRRESLARKVLFSRFAIDCIRCPIPSHAAIRCSQRFVALNGIVFLNICPFWSLLHKVRAKRPFFFHFITRKNRHSNIQRNFRLRSIQFRRA